VTVPFSRSGHVPADRHRSDARRSAVPEAGSPSNSRGLLSVPESKPMVSTCNKRTRWAGSASKMWREICTCFRHCRRHVLSR
jgi:hypothetical protein